ncbi:SWI5-dependent HO expression protein 4, partial [Coemansia thaxteri]
MTTANSKHAEIERLSSELRSGGHKDGSPAAVELLLARGKLYADTGDSRRATADMAQAAALAKGSGGVAAVERALRGLAVARDAHASESTETLVDRISRHAAEPRASSAQAAADAAHAVAARVGKTRNALAVVSEAQACALVDAFHAACMHGAADDVADAVAACAKAVLAQATQSGGKEARGMLERVAQRIGAAWAQPCSDGFRQRACRHGAGMYVEAAHALATQAGDHGTAAKDPPREDSAVTQHAYAFFVDHVWAVGTRDGAAEFREVGQGALRLAAANGALFAGLFARSGAAVERLLALLGQAGGGERRALALLVASQVAAAAARTEASQQQLAAAAARIADAWVQSGVQAERARGLRALAALCEAGARDAAAALWRRDGWAADLWEQAEFDHADTQRALLAFADAAAADAAAAAPMKAAGCALVRALARAEGDRALADAAAGVLAKWAGGGGGGSDPRDPGLDPLALADRHVRRMADGCPADAVEALGFLCLQPRVKEHVAAQHAAALRRLFAAAARPAAPAALTFAALMLIRNLTQYRPVLTAEQARLRQLQQKAAPGCKETAEETAEEEEARDAPDRVADRARTLCACGAPAVLVAAAQPHASDGAKDAVADVAVALATTPALRGLLAQQGVARALLGALSGDAPKASASGIHALRNPRDRSAAFALAKIAVSVPPHLAFADPRAVVRLLAALLAEESDPLALLMKFEALLALTNLASAPPQSSHDVRGFIANDLAAIGLVEMLMLADHVLVRRAATELLCNLVYDPLVFERYAKNADQQADDAPVPQIVEIADDDDDSSNDKDPAHRSHRLHLLVALADVDDLPTRSAAAGALAVLSSDPRVCRYLLLSHPRASDVLLRLADDPDCADDESHAAAFKHRVAVVWANAAACADPRLANALVQNQPL